MLLDRHKEKKKIKQQHDGSPQLLEHVAQSQREGGGNSDHYIGGETRCK